MEYTQQQIADYVTGWLGAGYETHNIIAVKAMLHNAFLMLEDPNDGIEWYVKRMNQNKNES